MVPTEFGFYWVSLDFAAFYWVILGYTGTCLIQRWEDMPSYDVAKKERKTFSSSWLQVMQVISGHAGHVRSCLLFEEPELSYVVPFCLPVWMLLLKPERLSGLFCGVFPCQIHWPAAREHVEHCRLAGKSLEVRCQSVSGGRRHLFLSGPTNIQNMTSPMKAVFLVCFSERLRQFRASSAAFQ